MKKIIQSLDLNIIPNNLNEFQKFLVLEVIILTMTLFAILHIIGYFYFIYILKDIDLDKKTLYYKIFNKLI